MQLRPGERFGRYELGELLGKGGMGEVYAAHDTILQRRVALKALVPASSDSGESASPDGAARILREARAAARISHPNAVAIFDVGEVGGIPFIAMELISGASLRTYVGDATIPLATRLRWLIDIARGLGAAHKLQLVHRDVKPDNVIVGTDGVVKVLDFGIARRTVTKLASRLDAPESPSVEEHAAALGTLTAEGVIVGTPAYMSPEQMRGDELDGRADQFSWGVMAFELLTGKPPWQGVGVALVAQILSREITSLEESVPGLPARADAVIRIALSKSRDGRFATMEELADELEPYAVGAESETVKGEGSGRKGASAPGDRMELAKTEADVAFRGITPQGVPTLTSVVRSPPRGRRGGALVAGVAALGALVAVVAGWTAAWNSRASHRAGAAIADAGGEAEAPSQMSPNAEATAAYKAGVRSLHDAAMGAAVKQLDRAVELDPLFAAAHLRRAIVRVIVDGGFTTGFNDELQKARNSRVSLGNRDRLLLEALEPCVQVPPDFAESRRRLEVATKKHVTDANLPLALGLVLDAMVQLAQAAAAFGATVERDPTFALAWRCIALERLGLSEIAGAMEAYEQCVKIAPGATSCLGDLSVLQANEGKCEELVTTSRRLIALAPESPGAYRALADGLLGSDQPIDAVHAALEEQWARESPAERQFDQLEEETSLAILRGDFAGAERQYAERERLSDSAPDDETHFNAVYGRMLLDLEIGRHAQADQLAGLYLRRRAAWSARGLDLTIAAFAVQFLGGGIDRKRFNGLRDQWLERNHDAPGYCWVEAYALVAETPDDAAVALASKPDVDPIVPALAMTPRYTEPVGRTYLLAGRFDQATRYLSQASSSCVSLELPEEILPATQAAFELGESLEAVGNAPGACSAYGRLLHRWGAARPPSQTVAKASVRMRRLGCSP